MNRKLVNSKLDKYRERGKGTYTFCQVGCDCNIAVNLLEKCENLQSKIDKANEIINKLEMQPAYLDCKYYELEGFKELKKVLKETENVENN